MNAQQQMMQLLRTSNAYYDSGLTDGWKFGQMTNSVYGNHIASGRTFFFSFDPESKVIKAESYSLEKPGSITAYTGTITLGGRVIAPDMILMLHTLFSFNFASDNVYVVENNRAKKIPPAKEKKKFSIASDNSLAHNQVLDSSSNTSQDSWDSAISAVPIPSKFSKFLRCVLFLGFHRSNS